MSQRTSSMTHFNSAANVALEIIKIEQGLATMFFDGAYALSEEVEFTELLKAFDDSMEAVEENVKKDLPLGKTLSEECVSWRSRKSEVRGAIDLGLDPQNFSSCRAMTKAATKLRKELKAASNPATIPPSGGSSNAGGGTPESKEVPMLHSVTSQFSDAVQAKIDKFLTDLEGLSEVGQLDTMKFAEGTIGKLKKQGGRFVHLKTA